MAQREREGRTESLIPNRDDLCLMLAFSLKKFSRIHFLLSLSFDRHPRLLPRDSVTSRLLQSF
jgi:hypothetical protein